MLEDISFISVVDNPPTSEDLYPTFGPTICTSKSSTSSASPSETIDFSITPVSRFAATDFQAIPAAPITVTSLDGNAVPLDVLSIPAAPIPVVSIADITSVPTSTAVLSEAPDTFATAAPNSSQVLAQTTSHILPVEFLPCATPTPSIDPLPLVSATSVATPVPHRTPTSPMVSAIPEDYCIPPTPDYPSIDVLVASSSLAAATPTATTFKTISATSVSTPSLPTVVCKLPSSSPVSSVSSNDATLQSASVSPPKAPVPGPSSTKSPNAHKGVLDYKFFPGKVIYKRKRSVNAPTPNVVSGNEFRKFLAQKTDKKTKKKKGEEWTCIYCERTYSEDMKSKKNLKWIECDACKRQMHVSCMPKSFLVKVQLDQNGDDEEVDFSCEFCN